MSEHKIPFIFSDAVNELLTERDFHLKLPKGIQSQAALFLHYEKEGHFPDYFGRNWDAFLDCLRDFSWTNCRRIVITHDDVPLLNDRHDLQVYLEILETAVKDWKEVRTGPLIEEYPNMSFTTHELIVVFPSSVEATVIRALELCP